MIFNMMKCDENWELDNESAAYTLQPLLSSKILEWVVVFPEVNLWSEESNLRNLEQAEKYFLPQFSHVLYPRFSSMHNIINILNKKDTNYKVMYDLTITYKIGTDREHQCPTLIQVFSSLQPIHVNIHIKAKLLSRVPVKRVKLEKYMEKLWVEKDKTLLQSSE